MTCLIELVRKEGEQIKWLGFGCLAVTAFVYHCVENDSYSPRHHRRIGTVKWMQGKVRWTVSVTLSA